MRSLGATMRSRGFPYVLTLTAIVLLLAATGMFVFERETNPAFDSYGTAVWWTAMLLTTMGSEFWLQTPECRLVCLLLSIYTFAMFDYITATLAASSSARHARRRARARRVDDELAHLRDEVR